MIPRSFSMAVSPRRFSWLPVLVITLLGLASSPVASAQEAPPPLVSAPAAVMINADDGDILFSQNPDQRLPMASTTKMMTALLVIEGGHDLDARVTVSQRAAEVGESSVWLQAGESLTVREVLTGMLVQSGNDAAMALAEYDAGSVEAFVEKMNRRAAELGMDNTHFTNPHGLDDPEHYTSAADFARLGMEVMKHEELREIVRTPVATIPWPGQPYGRTLFNHNHLLEAYPFVNGIKTGYTDAAGQCIVVSASERGINLVVAYLGGASTAQRNQEVVDLLNYGFANYRETAIIVAGQEYTRIDVPYDTGRQLAMVADRELVRQMHLKDEVTYRLVLPEEPRLPVRKGDRMGIVEAYKGETRLGEAFLLATEDVEEPGLGSRVTYYLSRLLPFV